MNLKKIKILFEKTASQENNGKEPKFYEELKDEYLKEINKYNQVSKKEVAMEFIMYELLNLTIDRFYRDDFNTIRLVLLPVSEYIIKDCKTENIYEYHKTIKELGKGLYGVGMFENSPGSKIESYQKMFMEEKL